MSLEALVWALRVPKSKLVDDSALRTLAILADYANEHGMCWPSKERLQHDRGVSRATITRHIADLFREGLILPGDSQLVAHMPSNRRPKVWQLNLPNRGLTDEPPAALWGLKSDHLGGSSGEPQNPIEPSRKSKTVTSPSRETARSETPADRPEIECIHEHPAIWYFDKRVGRHRPRCPYCRRNDAITLPEEALSHA